MPRIITGKARGIKLDTPIGRNTRPTADRAKEALFNILGNIFDDAYVLDLYSGSGSLGLEAISRGAKKCFFVDKSSQSISVLKKNIEKCRCSSATEIIRGDCIKAIELLGEKGVKFDCIFMDPPYNKDLVSLTIEKIYEADIIKKEIIIVAEHEISLMPPERISGFKRYATRGYGVIQFSFYRLISDTPKCLEVK